MDKMEEKLFLLATTVYKQLGQGHTENIYQKAMAFELQAAGLLVEMECNMPVIYEDMLGRKFNVGTERLDIVCRDSEADVNNFLIELKSATSFTGAALVTQIEKYLHQSVLNGRKINKGFGIQFMQPGTNPTPIDKGVKMVCVEYEGEKLVWHNYVPLI